jgi:hypothetical protein
VTTETAAMKCRTPRFYLDGPLGCKTLGAVNDCVVLAGFSSDGAAAAYCEGDAAQLWELRSLRSGEHRRVDPGQPRRPLLVAIDPPGPSELSLLAATLEDIATAIEHGQETVAAECRLIRDCAKNLWRHAKIVEGEEDAAAVARWFVACRCPPNVAPVCGAPMWYWLEWFNGRHVHTEHQTEDGTSVDQIVFAFSSHRAAAVFCAAPVARLDGSVRHCYLDTYSGYDFAVLVWEEGQPACARTVGKIGARLSADTR